MGIQEGSVCVCVWGRGGGGKGKQWVRKRRWVKEGWSWKVGLCSKGKVYLSFLFLSFFFSLHLVTVGTPSVSRNCICLCVCVCGSVTYGASTRRLKTWRKCDNCEWLCVFLPSLFPPHEVVAVPVQWLNRKLYGVVNVACKWTNRKEGIGKAARFCNSGT